MSPPLLPKRARVLVVNPFGIGDALFITPMIRALHKTGVERIDLLLGSRTRAVFEHHSFIHQIFEWDKTRVRGVRAKLKRVRTLMEMFWHLIRNRYDVMIDCSLGRQYSFLGQFLFWIPRRIGFNYKNRGTFLTERLQLPRAFHEKPVTEYYLDLIRLIGVPIESQRMELFLSDEDERESQNLTAQEGIVEGERFIVVAPGGGESWGKDARLRRWPISHFADFVRELVNYSADAPRHVFIVGSRGDMFRAEELRDLLRGISVHNVCGLTASVRGTAALMKRSSLVIANDSGLVHVANAMQRPVVAIYGPVNPAVYGPYPSSQKTLAAHRFGPPCRPCYQNMRYQADCAGVECLSQLSGKEVFRQIMESGLLDVALQEAPTQMDRV
jgi:lipopolysaccharide heptosyltransferase II